MRLYHAPDDWRHFLARQAWPEACVVTMGNFDGVHLGHRALLETTVAHARAAGLPALGISFEPHPRMLRDPSFLPLHSLDRRVEALAASGLDTLLLLPFSRAFASCDAASFSRDVLGGALRARELCVGHDFRMGRDQAGAGSLAAYGREAGFALVRVEARLFEGLPVSSSRIRQALASGDMASANAMLGSPFTVRGLVRHGAGRGGKLLGFPTANMDARGLAMPRPAVYATSARLAGGAVAYPALTSFGNNPTFGQQGLSLETFLLDFDQDIYGAELEVAFLQEMRQEKKFAGPDELRAQLQADLAARRAIPAMAF